MKTKINKNTIWIVSITLVIGIAVGYLISPASDQQISLPRRQAGKSANQSIGTSNNHQIWTCSMHPQIRKTEPGKCPICGMDLIPLNTEAETGDPDAVYMSPTAMQLANVQTTLVGYKKPEKEIRMPGKVQADERAVYTQSTHIPGRIEQLSVNFTGESVRKGQVVARIYSPELVTAQQELQEAYDIREQQPVLYQAAREKLKNWKISDAEIESMLQSKNPVENFPVTADVSGIVLEKKVNVGDYINRGTPIYDIANLSKVWVLFDVYENDLRWIEEGDRVTFTVQSLPGETFAGKITFIDPVIDPKTRAAKARVEISNPNMKLKPEMFATGVVTSELKDKQESLVVPKSAVMWTGERSVVYVKNETERGINFKLQEVTLGPALGDSYVIEKGLEPGTEIAVNGTFSIDAAAQLAGKPSMMNPEGGKTSTGHNHAGMDMSASSSENNQMQETTATDNEQAENTGDKFQEQLTAVVEKYLGLKDALVADELGKAKSSALAMKSQLEKVDMELVKGEMHNHWMSILNKLNTTLTEIQQEKSIEPVRKSFSALSDDLYAAIKMFGLKNEKVYYQFCPMANSNKGAYWISQFKEIKNPYYGEAMLTCGETKEELK